MNRKNIYIRMAVPEDAGTLLKIYEPYVKNTCITFEYQVPSVEEFTQRIRETLELDEETIVIPFSAEKGTGREELLSAILSGAGVS